MTRILTLRVSPDLLAKAETRAAQLGLDRGRYVRELIAQDVAQAGRSRRRTFSSESFIGSASAGSGPYTNDKVRALVRHRLSARREANR